MSAEGMFWQLPHPNVQLQFYLIFELRKQLEVVKENTEDQCRNMKRNVGLFPTVKTWDLITRSWRKGNLTIIPSPETL